MTFKCPRKSQPSTFLNKVISILFVILVIGTVFDYVLLNFSVLYFII